MKNHEKALVQCPKGPSPVSGDTGDSIILNASVASSKGFEMSTVYSATKAAMRSFAKTLDS
jgi:NADP-dependent 3-hydroxy acid dehydrogenase YdfG